MFITTEIKRKVLSLSDQHDIVEIYWAMRYDAIRANGKALYQQVHATLEGCQVDHKLIDEGFTI